MSHSHIGHFGLPPRWPALLQLTAMCQSLEFATHAYLNLPMSVRLASLNPVTHPTG
jgi:hypothetical protein